MGSDFKKQMDFLSSFFMDIYETTCWFWMEDDQNMAYQQLIACIQKYCYI